MSRRKKDLSAFQYVNLSNKYKENKLYDDATFNSHVDESSNTVCTSSILTDKPGQIVGPRSDAAFCGSDLIFKKYAVQSKVNKYLGKYGILRVSNP